MDGGRPRAGIAAKPQRDLTVAALDKRLNLRRRAREDAARNLPRHDASDLSEPERAVLEALEGERSKLDRARGEARAEVERRLRALAPTPQDFTSPALDARLTLKQTAGRLAHEWADARARSDAARADLDAFKNANDLRRAAVYPRSSLLQAGLLLVAAMFEALFSAALFAEDDARGLLGGAITAIGLSGANVTLGFLAGFLGLRYVQHRRLPQRIAGAAGFGALTLLALMLNLFAADWRDKLAALAGRDLGAGSDASFHLWSLLQLESPQAIILLMLGAGVWVFAALKGYSGFDDPYPDYGKMDRSAREAGDALSAFRTEARLELEEPINAARTALAGRLEKMRGEFEAMNKAFDAAAVQMEALDAQARALDEAAAGAIHLYRQENAAARGNAAPLYFGAPPPEVGPSLDVLAAAATMIDDARARLAEAQTQFADALVGLLAELDTVTRALDGGAPA